VVDDQLYFINHIRTAWSCRFGLYNMRRIRPFLHNSLSKLLFYPDWNIVMLFWQAFQHGLSNLCKRSMAGLPAWTVKPMQEIQHAAPRVVFNKPKRVHVTPLFINLLRFPIATRIKFTALMFAYRTTNGSAPIYLNSLKSSPEACVLQVNVTLWCHPNEAQNHMRVQLSSYWSDFLFIIHQDD